MTFWAPPPPPPPSRPLLHLALFLLTLLSTTFAGAAFAGRDALESPASFASGLPFSVTLLAILVAHEFGHYFAARGWGVLVTLPYFIPVPPPFLFGTWGAFIKIRSHIPNRRALVDIGASGPIAGFILALAASYVGVKLSVNSSSWPPPGGFEGEGTVLHLGDSLAFMLMSSLAAGGASTDGLLLHPVAAAGWAGLFVTAINLFPVSQLDGGHVAYALFGRRFGAIGIIATAALLFLGLLYWPGWLFFLLLILILAGRRHPPPLEPYTGLNRPRKLLGAFTLVVFLLCFMPEPLRFEG